jgi:hypothetical protein
MIDLFWRWWRRLRRRRSLKHCRTVESMTDVPENPGADLFVVHRQGLDRRVAFACPCRCGRRIDLSLMKADWPHWSLVRNNDAVTLTPSIWLRADPCGSHFLVRGNRIVWIQR